MQYYLSASLLLFEIPAMYAILFFRRLVFGSSPPLGVCGYSLIRELSSKKLHLIGGAFLYVTSCRYLPLNFLKIWDDDQSKSYSFARVSIDIASDFIKIIIDSTSISSLEPYLTMLHELSPDHIWANICDLQAIFIVWFLKFYFFDMSIFCDIWLRKSDISSCDIADSSM